jgi:formylglycine-generating enzyme required for sulfatase activity
LVASALLSLLGAGCATLAQPISLEGLEPDPAAGVDARSGLPKRATHRRSGVVLRLVPGEATANALYLAETELTVGSWRRFVAETGYRSDAEWGVTDDPAHAAVGAFTATPAGGREWHEQANWSRIFPLLGTEELRDDLPVLYLSAADAVAFTAYFGLRLPSAAEWERAARAGATTRFPWGDEGGDACRRANLQDRAGARRFPEFNVPVPCDDGFAAVAPVASFAPNAAGFFDLVGNVEEWCVDADHTPSHYELVGGSWVADADGATFAQRASLHQHARRDFIGFRPALAIELPGR